MGVCAAGDHEQLGSSGQRAQSPVVPVTGSCTILGGIEQRMVAMWMMLGCMLACGSRAPSSGEPTATAMTTTTDGGSTSTSTGSGTSGEDTADVWADVVAVSATEKAHDRIV